MHQELLTQCAIGVHAKKGRTLSQHFVTSRPYLFGFIRLEVPLQDQVVVTAATRHGDIGIWLTTYIPYGEQLIGTAPSQAADQL